MNVECWELYKKLRADGSIGKVWTPSLTHGWLLSPADALPGLEYSIAEPTSIQALTNLIYAKSGVELPLVKIGPKSELRPFNQSYNCFKKIG